MELDSPQPTNPAAPAPETTQALQTKGNLFTKHLAWWLVLFVACLVSALATTNPPARHELLWAAVLGTAIGMLLGATALAGVAYLINRAFGSRLSTVQFMSTVTTALTICIAARIFVSKYAPPAQTAPLASATQAPQQQQAPPPQQSPAPDDPASSILPVQPAPGHPVKSWNAREREKELPFQCMSNKDLIAAAQSGEPGALVTLGDRYQRGYNLPDDVLPADRDKAIACYKKAAATEFPKAYYHLAKLLQFGDAPADKIDSEKMLRQAAVLGHADAQFQLGLQLTTSETNTASFREGIAWFGKAAAQQEIGASLYLGTLYETGHGVPKDKAKAAAYYASAANVAYDPFDFMPGAMGPARQARLCLQMLSDQGFGIPPTREAAVGIYRKAAEAGNPTAQFLLSQIYQLSYGITNTGPDSYAQNTAESESWLRKAAEAGHPEAQFLLGSGLLLKQETKAEARDWLLKAVNQHVGPAYKPLLSSGSQARGPVEIGSATITLHPTSFYDHRTAALLAYKQRDWTNALAFFEAAAETGDADSQYALAVMYSLGQGAPANPDKARQWLDKAARPPSAAALVDIAITRMRGETNEIMLALAMHDLKLAADMGCEKAKHAFLLYESQFPGIYYRWNNPSTLSLDPKAPNPLLQGIKAIHIPRPFLDQETAKVISAEALQSAAELRLRSAGIKLIDQSSLPALNIEAECTVVGDGPLYAVRIRLTLEATVEYHFNTKVAPIWERDIMSWAGSSKLPSHTKGIVEDITDRFANDFLKANSKP